jgi:membrane protein DedA with SNARE-associated domain
MGACKLSIADRKATDKQVIEIVSTGEERGTMKEKRVRRKVVPLLTLILITVISVGLFIYGRDPERIAQLEKFRYLGAFLISIMGNASVLLPGIVLPILTALGADCYQSSGWLAGPIIIGLAGGTGAAIGEIVGYMAGYSGSIIVENKKRYHRFVGWVRQWGAVAIFVFALVPLFFDLVGIVAGVIRFPLWKFLLLCWLGRTILYVSVVVAISLGWARILPYLG